jgi:hypothetical protein
MHNDFDRQFQQRSVDASGSSERRSLMSARIAAASRVLLSDEEAPPPEVSTQALASFSSSCKRTSRIGRYSVATWSRKLDAKSGGGAGSDVFATKTSKAAVLFIADTQTWLRYAQHSAARAPGWVVLLDSAATRRAFARSLWKRNDIGPSRMIDPLPESSAWRSEIGM